MGDTGDYDYVYSPVLSTTDQGLLVTCWTNNQRHSTKPASREVYYTEKPKKKPSFRIMTSTQNNKWNSDTNRSDVKSPNWKYHNQVDGGSKRQETKETKVKPVLIMCCPWQQKSAKKSGGDIEIQMTKKTSKSDGSYVDCKEELQWSENSKKEKVDDRIIASEAKEKKGENYQTELNLTLNNGQIEGHTTESSTQQMTQTSTCITTQHNGTQENFVHTGMNGHEIDVITPEMEKGTFESGNYNVNQMNMLNSDYSEIQQQNTQPVIRYQKLRDKSSSSASETEVNTRTSSSEMDIDGMINMLEEQTEGLEKSRSTLRKKVYRRSASEGTMSLARSLGSLYTIEEQYDNHPTEETPVFNDGEIYVDKEKIRMNKMETRQLEEANDDPEFFNVPKFPVNINKNSYQKSHTISRYPQSASQSRFATYREREGSPGYTKTMSMTIRNNPLYVYDKQYRGFHSTQTLNTGQEYEELPDTCSIYSSVSNINEADPMRSRLDSYSYGTQTDDEEGPLEVQHDLLSWGRDIDTQSALNMPVSQPRKAQTLHVNTRLQVPENRSSSTSPQTATSFYRAGFGVLESSSNAIHNRIVNVIIRNKTKFCLAEVDFNADENTNLVRKVGRVIDHKMHGTMQLTQETVWDTIRYVGVYELQGIKTHLRDSWFLYTEFSWEGKLCEPVMTVGFFNAYYDQMNAHKTGHDGHHLFRKIKMSSQRVKVACKMKRGLAHADVELIVKQD